MYLQTLVILFSIGNTFSGFLSVLDDCKYWDYLKVYGNGGKKRVHCILDQNFQSGLVYTEWKMIPKGTCPVYNRFARQIDSIPCNKSIGVCPKEIFPSYSGVTFTGCYDVIRKKANVMRPTVPPAVSDHDNYAAPSVIITALSACINCVFITVCFWHFICRSKIKLCRDEYGMPRSSDGKTPDQIATNPVFGSSEDEMQRRRAEKNGVLDASKLVDDKYGMTTITPNELMAYLETKPVDAKVQKTPYSRRTSETYSQISSTNSKASEDHLVDTESGKESCYM